VRAVLLVGEVPREAGLGNVGNNVGNDIINDIIGPTLSMMK
jgi:hypothetical protein